MAISPQGVIRSTSCLILGGVFGVGGSNGAIIFGFDKSKMAARPPSWKIQICDISAAGHPIYSVFGYRMRFSGSADRMAPFPV